MKKVLLALLALVCCVAAMAQKISDENLDDLAQELGRRSQYDEMKARRLGNLKVLAKDSLRTLGDRLNAIYALGNEYAYFETDSALHYYNHVILHADSLLAAKAKLGTANVFVIKGAFQEGLQMIEEVENSPQRDKVEIECLESYCLCYTYMGEYATSDVNAEKYRKLHARYREQLIARLDKDSPLHRFYRAEKASEEGRLDEAELILRKLVSDLPETNIIYARATATLGDLYRTKSMPDEATYFYCISAISDIKASVKAHTSLQRLAEMVFLKDDPIRAHHYLSMALNDAVAYSSRLRIAEIATKLTTVDKAYSQHAQRNRDWMIIIVGLVVVFAICLIGAVVSILHDRKKIITVNSRLQRALGLKDEYISQFLELCSIYMDRLDAFSTTVARKIKAGQTEDLLRLSQSTKFSEDQHKIFHERFDNAFLKIYPTFIEEFNALLQPGEQIVPKEAGQLTTELRIFALLRMGVDDSAKIANFLNLSVNTIYAYRNKVRNKAIEREIFDRKVLDIGKL